MADALLLQKPASPGSGTLVSKYVAVGTSSAIERTPPTSLPLASLTWVPSD